MSLPLQQEFWAWLLTKSVAEWGLTTYEQDWLYNELMGVDVLLTNATLGRQWLTQLGSGAAAAGVSVQLCMAYPRHALQSLEMPTATQIRASDDHVPGRGGGNTQVQWKMGYSSMLAWALGLAPFKDNYWSSAQQPGSSCGSNASEVTPSLHNAASTYSAGPVSPGDGVGLSDVAQILRACNAAGLLLHPSRPATALDSQVAYVGPHPPPPPHPPRPKIPQNHPLTKKRTPQTHREKQARRVWRRRGAARGQCARYVHAAQRLGVGPRHGREPRRAVRAHRG
jgi:hypothetical protein